MNSACEGCWSSRAVSAAATIAAASASASAAPAAAAAAAGPALSGTCAVVTPGRRLQSPPSPPPGSAVTSCSCFPVGPAGLTFDSQPSAVAGAWPGPAGKVARRETELSQAEPRARGRRRRAPWVDAAPRLLARPEGSGKGGRSRVSGHLGQARDRRRLAVPIGCGLSTCSPRDRLALLLFICLFLSFSRVPFGSSSGAAALALASPRPVGDGGFHLP